MAAFKQLNSQDVIVSPLEVNKSFRFTKSGSAYSFFEGNLPFNKLAPSASDVGIDSLYGLNNKYFDNLEVTGKDEEIRQVSAYRSVRHLYYSNYIHATSSIFPQARPTIYNEDGTLSGEQYSTTYHNYRQTDLEEKKIFRFRENAPVGIFSIPTQLYGDYIQPHSLKITAPSSGSFSGGILSDDGEGRLLYSEGIVGNVIYTHGLAILSNTGSTPVDYGEAVYSGSGVQSAIYQDINGLNQNEEDFIQNFVNADDLVYEFSSSRTLYETQYKITLNESEYNYTLNPSLTSDNLGLVSNFATGSEFSPYVTTVGLYNDNQELIAVGKLAQPLATSRTTDTTILVNLDRH